MRSLSLIFRFVDTRPLNSRFAGLKAALTLGLTAALSAGMVPAAHASISIFNNQALFEAAFTNLATDSYLNTFPGGSGQQTNYTASGSGFNYAATQSGTNGFNSALTYRTSSTTLQAYNDGQTLIFTATGGNYNAIGGNFFVSTFTGNFVSTAVTVTVSNGTDTISQNYSPSSATVNSFQGFVSTKPITTLTISGASAQNENDNTADNLRVGTVAVSAPEPGSLALLLPVMGTIGAAGGVVRKRRKM